MHRVLSLVPAVTVVFSATLGAHAASHLVEAALFTIPAHEGRRGTAPQRPRRAKNGALTGVFPGRPVVGSRPPLPIALVATQIGAVRQCTLVHEVTGAAGGFFVGDEVFGLGAVHAVGSDQVWIKETNGVVRSVGFARVSTRRAIASATPGLGRAEFKRLLENPAALRGVRAVPVREGGRAAGFRLYGIGPRSPLARVGLANGDIILGINGVELHGMDAALLAYQTLSKETHFRVKLRRRGRLVEHVVTIE